MFETLYICGTLKIPWTKTNTDCSNGTRGALHLLRWNQEMRQSALVLPLPDSGNADGSCVARGEVEERRRKMAYLSALEPVVPENHAGMLSRRHPEDPMDGEVASSDHSRFVETATGGR